MEISGITPGDAVLVHAEGGVVRLTLARPENRNALSTDLLDGLHAGLTAAGNRPGVRSVVIDHLGPVFCAGADLRAGSGVAALPPVLDAVVACPVPVVARVAGPALGGGLALVAACDISVVADDVRLGFTEVRFGVIPAVVSVVCLPKMRPGDALELFLTGERVPAARAADMGVVSRAVPREDLDAAVAGYCAAIAKGGPQAVAGTKAFLRGGSRVRPEGWAEAVGRSERWFAATEAQEARTAFLEHRAPEWVAG